MRYKIGDIVEFNKQPGIQHIITQEILNNYGTFEYATHLTAWLTPKELKLIKKSSKKTINNLLTYKDKDYE